VAAVSEVVEVPRSVLEEVLRWIEELERAVERISGGKEGR